MKSVASGVVNRSRLSLATLAQINYKYDNKREDSNYASHLNEDKATGTPFTITKLVHKCSFVAIDLKKKQLILFAIKEEINSLYGYDIQLNIFTFTLKDILPKMYKVTGLIVTEKGTILSYYKKKHAYPDNYYNYICQVSQTYKKCSVIYQQCFINFYVSLKYGINKLIYMKLTRHRHRIIKEELFVVNNFTNSITNLFGKMIYNTTINKIVNIYTIATHYFLLVKPVAWMTDIYKIVYVYEFSVKWFINIQSKCYTDMFVQDNQLLVITFIKKIIIIQYNLIAK